MSSIDSSFPQPPLAIPWPHIVMMVISYVSMLLYVWIVVLILINRRNYPAMQSAFYGLLLNQAFADLCIFLIIELNLRPRKFRLLPMFTPQTNTLFPKLSHFAMVTTRSAMFLGYFPFALNRFTTFFRPDLHKKMWTQKTAFLCALLQWLPPLLVNCFAYFVMPSEVSFVVREGGFLHMLSDQTLAYISGIQSIVTGVMVAAICTVLYTWTLVYIRKNWKKCDEVAKCETRLFVCASITFLPMLLEAIRSVVQLVSYYGFDSTIVYTICTELFFFTAEFASITQPWTILFTSKLIRRLLWKKRKYVTPLVVDTRT